VAPPPPSNPDPVAWAPPAYTPPPPAPPVPPSTYAPVPGASTPVTPYPAKKSNTLLKVVIALVILICVGSAFVLAGLYYAARKVTQKVHQVAEQARQESTSSTAGGLAGLLGASPGSGENGGGFKGDPCRFLSKADVTRAIGVPIIRTEVEDAECRYIAKGNPADGTSKHMAAMFAGLGVDAQTQKTLQKMAGAFFAQEQANDKDLSAETASGEIPVLVLSFSYGNAVTEMRMNRGILDRLGGSSLMPGSNDQAARSATGDLTGIGNEAYVAGGSMMLVRKGNTLARLLYVSCPCNTDNIKPLARKLAAQL
jgi:hypothetical protein